MVVVLAAVMLVLTRSVSFADYADGYRTAQVNTLSEAVKVWRRAAWRQDDYFAQIRLGDLYSGNQSFPTNEGTKNPSFYDPVEAYVWYFIALRPHHRYHVSDNADAVNKLYTIRSNAFTNANNLFDTMTFEQRLEARARIIYILASRGADGFFTLGRLQYYGPNVSPYDGEGTRPPPPKPPYVLACWRSWWARGKVRLWFWSLWSSHEPAPYWRWVKRTNENYNSPNHMMPDDLACQRDTTVPPEPDENKQFNSAYGSAGQAGAVQLSGNAAGGQNSAPNNTLAGPGSVSIGGGSSVDTVMTPGSGGGGAGYNGADSAAYSGDNSQSGTANDDWNSSNSSSSDWTVSSVFSENDLEALIYFEKARMLGYPLAASYVDAIKNGSPDGQQIFADAEKRARYWAPPFEYYPGVTAGGLPHSDESVPSLEQRIALGRVREIPFYAVRHALAFRGLLKHHGCGSPRACFRRGVAAFQSSLGFEPTGVLTAQETVRLIQMAAVDGNADAQDRLGIMYAKGIGVPLNYPRAEKWFIKAGNQRQGDALFNLYVLYKVGPNGIEHNEDKALSFYVQAATIAKNARARCELLDLLAKADDAGRDHGAKK